MVVRLVVKNMEGLWKAFVIIIIVIINNHGKWYLIINYTCSYVYSITSTAPTWHLLNLWDNVEEITGMPFHLFPVIRQYRPPRQMIGSLWLIDLLIRTTAIPTLDLCMISLIYHRYYHRLFSNSTKALRLFISSPDKQENGGPSSALREMCPVRTRQSQF